MNAGGSVQDGMRRGELRSPALRSVIQNAEGAGERNSPLRQVFERVGESLQPFRPHEKREKFM